MSTNNILCCDSWLYSLNIFHRPFVGFCIGCLICLFFGSRCLYDDIYYQPNTWTLSAADTVSTKSDTRKKRKKSKRRRRKSSQDKPPLPKKEPKVSKIDENDYEDIVVIPDTGIDIYTKYGHQDPYADWDTAFLPYIWMIRLLFMHSLGHDSKAIYPCGVLWVESYSPVVYVVWPESFPGRF